jgi:hypothetical protein
MRSFLYWRGKKHLLAERALRERNFAEIILDYFDHFSQLIIASFAEILLPIPFFTLAIAVIDHFLATANFCIGPPITIICIAAWI